MRAVLRWSVFPLLMAATVVATALLMTALSPTLTAGLVGLALLFAIWGLERVMPFQAAWNAKDPERLHDVGHLVIGTGLGAKAGDLLVELLFAQLGLWMVAATTSSALPLAGAPLGWQIVIVYVVADLGRYWQHRWHHRSPWLWRFHALHHSAEQMNVFKTSRSHFVERLLQQVFMFGPLALLGASPEALVWYVVPNSFLGMLDHSNLDVELPRWLERVVMSPNAHRIHHARDASRAQKNFGSAIVLWDQVFGTFEAPSPARPTTDVGLDPKDAFPKSFIKQVLGARP